MARFVNMVRLQNMQDFPLWELRELEEGNIVPLSPKP
jgi:hypothetical protein